MTVEATPQEEQLRRKVADADRGIRSLAGRLMFRDEIDAISRRQVRLDDLEASLEKARNAGYVFGGDLEDQLGLAKAAAGRALEGAREASEEAGRLLRPRADAAASEASALARDSNLSDQVLRVESLEREAEALEQAAREAEGRVTALARPFTEPFDSVERRLKEVHSMLEAFESRSFDMAPEESPVAAIEVSWIDPPDGEKMEGLLLLTDHRLRFEQREERVTKRKFLIFTAEKETIQKCWVDEPLGHLESSEDQAKGFLIKDQLLVLQWSSAARSGRTTTFELERGKAKDVDALVESALSGEINRQRWSGAVGQLADVQLSWPTRCDDCGATLTLPVKGQTILVCGFCGRQYQGRPAEGSS